MPEFSGKAAAKEPRSPLKYGECASDTSRVALLTTCSPLAFATPLVESDLGSNTLVAEINLDGPDSGVIFRVRESPGPTGTHLEWVHEG